MGYLREMIKTSKAWAQARGLCETSEIHGREEWRIPTERTFEHNKITATESRQQVSFVAEDRYDSNSLDGRPTKTWLYDIGHHIKKIVIFQIGSIDSSMFVVVSPSSARTPRELCWRWNQTVRQWCAFGIFNYQQYTCIL